MLTSLQAVGGAAVNNSVTYPSGSTTPDFAHQTAFFSENLVPAPSYAQWDGENSIFAVWFGINDVYQTYLELLSTSGLNGQSFDTYMNQLDIMYAAGGATFCSLYSSS